MKSVRVLIQLDGKTEDIGEVEVALSKLLDIARHGLENGLRIRGVFDGPFCADALDALGEVHLAHSRKRPDGDLLQRSDTAAMLTIAALGDAKVCLEALVETFGMSSTLMDAPKSTVN